MTKKPLIISFLIFGLFALSSCTFNPFPVTKAPVEILVEDFPVDTLPIATSSTDQVEVVATSSNSEEAIEASSSVKFVRTYQKDIDYQLDAPIDYFVVAPKVEEFICDFNKECPCIPNANYSSQKGFCSSIASSSRQVIGGREYCVQKIREGAAGSTYTSYVYTLPLSKDSGRCASLQFTKRTVTSCLIYEGNDTDIKNCEAENAMVRVMIDRVVSSFKISAAPSLLIDLKTASANVLKAISEKNFKELATFVGSDRKLCFSPYANIDDLAECFSKNELENAFTDSKQYVWGYYDGKGDQIILNFAEYYKKFIYDKNYLDDAEYFFGDPVSRGNTTLNLKETYPKGLFSEYYIKPNKDGLDWGSLRFVFENVDGQLYLRAIIHDQWTI